MGKYTVNTFNIYGGTNLNIGANLNIDNQTITFGSKKKNITTSLSAPKIGATSSFQSTSEKKVSNNKFNNVYTEYENEPISIIDINDIRSLVVLQSSNKNIYISDEINKRDNTIYIPSATEFTLFGDLIGKKDTDGSTIYSSDDVIYTKKENPNGITIDGVTFKFEKPPSFPSVMNLTEGKGKVAYIGAQNISF